VFYLTSEMKIQEVKHRPSKPLKHMPKNWHISISSGIPMEMHSAVGIATLMRNIMEIYDVTILS